MANRVNSFNVQGSKYSIEADLQFDSTPTIGSSNPVTSNGIAIAIQGATIGDNISYGRTPNTDIGNCSVAYGNNVMATAPYCIVFGDENKSTSYCGLTVGYGNKTYGEGQLVSIGQSNYTVGTSDFTLGASNTMGFTISNDNVPGDNSLIYVGYVDISTKKIYYDPEMTNQIPVGLSSGNWVYYIDLTDTSGREPGDAYEYKRVNNMTYTLTKLDNHYVHFTNRCENMVYTYRGKCYYDQANDRAYANYDPQTQTYSNDLDNQSALTRPRTGHIYIDLISGKFIARVSGNLIGSNSSVRWLKVKPYKTGQGGSYNPVSISRQSMRNNYGIYAYVRTNVTSKKYRVYSSSDYDDASDITDTIIDGEIVIDISSRAMNKVFIYRCDSDGVPRLATIINSTSNGSGKWYNGIFVFPSYSAIIGRTNYSGGGEGSFICGQSNNAEGAYEGLAVFGGGNNIIAGPGNGNNCYSFVAGRNHQITCESYFFHNFSVIGFENIIDLDSTQSNRICLLGSHDKTYGHNVEDVVITGSNNTAYSSTMLSIHGDHCTATRTSNLCIIGSFNSSTGFPVTTLTKNKQGIWEGTGVTYDSSTGTYSYPQNIIFEKIGLPDGYNDNEEDLTNRFLGYSISTNGSTLTTFNKTVNDDSIIVGSENSCGLDNTVQILSESSIDNIKYNYIFGSYNVLAYRANYREIGLVGSHLEVKGPIEKRSLIIGSCNSMEGTTGAKLIVGIGTIDDNGDNAVRKNGFVAFGSGVLAAPSSPDTINAGVSAMASTGLSSDKMIVTYAMMKDYTGPGGGGSSRPSVSIVTLEEADWDSVDLTNTVSLTGMTSGAIVIVQPVGSPYAYNLHNVYLDSQSDDSLTFKCVTTPDIDIQVKVVYWL